MVLKEPKISDFIYEEIRQCEDYALLNMITFEAAIRNEKVMGILNHLDSVSSKDRLDAILEVDDRYSQMIRELRENYFLDYDAYARYIREKNNFLERHGGKINIDLEYQRVIDKIQSGYIADISSYKRLSVKEQVQLYKKKYGYNVIVDHDEHAAHTHYLTLPLYRPKMHAPQKESVIYIEIPMYHIHPKHMKRYYERLAEEHMKIMEEARDYYKYEKLFFDEADEKQSKAKTYAQMFFVWDYMAWWEEQDKTLTPTKTKRTVYAEIAEMISANVEDKSGRPSAVEKYFEEMNRLIGKNRYKEFYIQRT